MAEELFSFPDRFESNRLILERPAPIGFPLAEEIFEAVEVSRESLRPWLPWVDKTHSAEDELLYFLHDYADKKWQAKTAAPYLIRHKETKAFLGVVDIMDLDSPQKRGEIGYWLSDKAVGFGYMTEAIHALEAQAFELGIHRIVIRNDTLNLRSAATAKRAGYRLEGVMRQDVWIPERQAWRDTNLWAKLQSEWQKVRQRD